MFHQWSRVGFSTPPGPFRRSNGLGDKSPLAPMTPRQKQITSSRKAVAPSVFLLFLGVFCFLMARAVVAAESTSEGELRTAAQVRSLTPEQAAQRLRVKLRGVVTFYDENLYSRFIQDDTEGIYLAYVTNMPALTPGQIVEVEGVTSPGEYAPIVEPRSVKIVGEGKLPPAKPVSIEELVSGHEDSQFVEVRGIVRSVRFEMESQHYLIDLVTGGERFTVHVRQLPVAQAEDIVDCTVRARGVCSTLFNLQRQLFGFRLLVPRPTDLVIEKPAPSNPFDIPVQSISSLLQFTPQGTFGHRVKLSGTVTYHESGIAIFIQDASEGLYCQTRQRTPVSPGDRVEVLGFPAKGEYTPVLQDAVYRKVGDGELPEPAAVDLDDALTGKHDCQLVRIHARLLERTQRGREQFLVLDTAGFIFHAYLAPEASQSGLAGLQNGSDVAVTGICLIERGSGWRAGGGWRAKSFRLLLRSPQDIVVLKTPPQWVRWGIVRTVGSLGVILLAALIWIAVLHRRLARHRAQVLKKTVQL